MVDIKGRKQKVINKSIIIGRLTRDPELRHMQNGVAVTNFTVAVQRSFKNSQGEYEADFIPVVVWRAQAENCAKYLAKGRLVGVAGRIQTRNYEDKEGVRRYITEIVADEVQFIDFGDSKGSQSGAPDGFIPIPDDDDELPF